MYKKAVSAFVKVMHIAAKLGLLWVDFTGRSA